MKPWSWHCSKLHLRPIQLISDLYSVLIYRIGNSHQLQFPWSTSWALSFPIRVYNEKAQTFWEQSAGGSFNLLISVKEFLFRSSELTLSSSMMLTDFKGLQWTLRIKYLKIKIGIGWAVVPRPVILASILEDEARAWATQWLSTKPAGSYLKSTVEF